MMHYFFRGGYRVGATHVRNTGWLKEMIEAYPEPFDVSISAPTGTIYGRSNADTSCEFGLRRLPLAPDHRLLVNTLCDLSRKAAAFHHKGRRSCADCAHRSIGEVTETPKHGYPTMETVVLCDRDALGDDYNMRIYCPEWERAEGEA